MTILRLKSGFNSAYLQDSIAEQLVIQNGCDYLVGLQLKPYYLSYPVTAFTWFPFMMFCPDMLERSNYYIS
jgi:hypothetical protein